MASKKSSKTYDRALTVLVCISVPLLIVSFIVGNYGPDLMANGLCFSHLGCNTGFFGFDMLVHFLNAVTDTLVLLWLMRRFPSLNLLHQSYWKDLLILVSIVLLIAFLWEFAEFVPDQYRMIVLHQNLIHPDTLYQVSNTDTMGDMLSAIVGTFCVGPVFLRLFRKD